MPNSFVRSSYGVEKGSCALSSLTPTRPLPIASSLSILSSGLTFSMNPLIGAFVVLVQGVFSIFLVTALVEREVFW